jgi:hypothetical protein
LEDEKLNSRLLCGGNFGRLLASGQIIVTLFMPCGAMVAERGQILFRMRRLGAFENNRKNIQKRSRFIFA